MKVIFLLLISLSVNAAGVFRYSGQLTKEGGQFFLTSEARALNPFRIRLSPLPALSAAKKISIETKEDTSLLSQDAVSKYKIVSLAPSPQDLHQGQKTK